MKYLQATAVACLIVLAGAGCASSKTVAVTPVATVPPANAPVAKPSSTASETFQSEHADFAYTLSWDADLLTQSTKPYPGASDSAPSFDIDGGGTITVATGWIDSPGYDMRQFVSHTYKNDAALLPATEHAPSSAGTTNPTYYFTETRSGCLVQFGVVKGLNEALSVRLEDCASNDMRSSQAFLDLLSDVVVVVQDPKNLK